MQRVDRGVAVDMKERPHLGAPAHRRGVRVRRRRHLLDDANRLAQQRRVEPALADPKGQSVEVPPREVRDRDEAMVLAHRRPAQPLRIFAPPVLVCVGSVLRDHHEAPAVAAECGVLRLHVRLHHGARGHTCKEVEGLGARGELAILTDKRLVFELLQDRLGSCAIVHKLRSGLTVGLGRVERREFLFDPLTDEEWGS